MKRFVGYFTGERAETDDLICFFYHAARESKQCERYLKDAEQVDDGELVEFFKEIQAQDRLRLWRAEQLLNRRIEYLGVGPGRRAARPNGVIHNGHP